MTRIIAAALLVLVLAGCDPGETEFKSGDDDGTGLGFVITPKGAGVGIDIGDGLYIDPITGGIGVGIPLG